MVIMKCTLCSKEILNYDERFNHLKIDDSHSADICSSCVDKFNEWHGKVLATLFPSKAMKKRFGQ